MDEIFRFNGSIKSITIEKADVFKSGLSWKEDIRRFFARIIFTETGEIAERHTDSEREIYAYGTNGLLLKIDRIDKDNDRLLSETTWEYGQDGLPLKKTETDGSGNILKTVFFEHDPRNRVIAEKSKSGILVKKFNERQQILSEYRYTGQEPDLMKDYQYGNDNHLQSITFRTAAGEIIRKEEFEYTDSGYLKSEKIINAEKSVIINTLYEYADIHKGNWLKRTRFSVIEDAKKIREIPVEIIYRSITEDRESLSASPKDQPAGGGTLEFPNGTFTGEIKNGIMDGHGIFRYKDGNLYEGEFAKGIMTGKGRFRWADGKEYTGDFKNGAMDGQGICTWPNGDRYEGEFKEGMMHGIGKFCWSSGDEFQGLFEKNHRTDQGIVETAEEKEQTS